MRSDYLPIVGKTVIETLTAGMYADSLFIYREYVQNAADQIDIAVEENILKRKSDGIIEITCDPFKKEIHINDNATGISSRNVLTFLSDVANSTKSSDKRKGFRGIGRLGGLGYCNRLVFETSFKGEDTISIITLDAVLLALILSDKANSADAASVIQTITSIEQREGDNSAHYFKVSLYNVTDAKLYDIKSVTDYLSMVAPISFSHDFSFAKQIEDYFFSKNVILDEYIVKLNGTILTKPYSNTIDDNGKISKVIGIDFLEIRDVEKNLIGIGWYAFRDQANFILSENVLVKGIRVRRNNIGIGSEKETNKFFELPQGKAPPRTNARLIGEIYALGPGFIPNARRDYFNNNETLITFETKIKKFFLAEDLENLLGQNASKLYNRLEELQDYQNKYDRFQSKSGQFEDQAEEHHKASELKHAKDKAVYARKVIDKIEQKSYENKKLAKLYETIIGDKNLLVPGEDDDIIAANNYNPLPFKKLSAEQAQVARDIIEIMEEILGYEKSRPLKAAILKKYN